MKSNLHLLLCFATGLFQNAAVAQMPVRQEPRHRMVLENEYIRLFDVHIAPGDTTFYHTHAQPSVVVIISKSVIGTQVLGKPPTTGGLVTPGITSFKDYGNHPLSHRVWNESPGTFHVMDIELLHQPQPGILWPVLSPNYLTLNWEQPQVRSFHLSLPAGKSYTIPASSCGYLLVVIRGAAMTTSAKRVPTGAKQQTPGQYRWFPPKTEVSLTARGNLDAVLLELK